MKKLVLFFLLACLFVPKAKAQDDGIIAAAAGIAANLGEKAADTFGQDQHPDLKADYIMANPLSV